LSIQTLGILSLTLLLLFCSRASGSIRSKPPSDGSIERYKAHLIARGFQQQYGRDYEETFAPVAHRTTVYTLIAVASVRRWTISQLDMKNAR
jgi:hypothetical protein